MTATEPSGVQAGQAARASGLRAMRRRATGLLVVVTGAFAAIAGFGGDEVWTGYALAAAEGSMVGGLADWFAVTALFRHPLGIPIPHTAIIRVRKDQFGETLGQFVQDNFLSPDVVGARVREAAIADRMATWLTVPANADVVARTALEAVSGLAELVGDEDVHRVLDAEVERLLSGLPVGPIAGRALRIAMEEGRHQQLLDGVLRAAAALLEEQREPLRARFAEESPWWLPGAVEDRLFERIIDGAGLFLRSVIDDPNHELRGTFQARVVMLADRLEHDAEMQAAVDDLRRQVLAHPELRGWTRSLWAEVKERLRAEVAGERAELRSRVADAVAGAGSQLAADPRLRARLEDGAEAAARYVADHHRGELSALISATIARWDADETSSRLELLLGRDLQFIRINGTIVGGLAGLAIHAAAVALRG